MNAVLKHLSQHDLTRPTTFEYTVLKIGNYIADYHLLFTVRYVDSVLSLSRGDARIKYSWSPARSVKFVLEEAPQASPL